MRGIMNEEEIGEVEPSGSNHLAVVSETNGDETAAMNTVIKFLYNGQVISTESFRTHSRLDEVKTKMAERFHVAVEIHHRGAVVQDDVLLTELGAVALGTIELELDSAEGVDLSKVYRPPALPTVDVIMVRISQSNTETRELIVEIEKPEEIKPWLGGYRNRITKVVYHNAATQTISQKKTKVPSSSQSVQTPMFPLKQSETNTMIHKTIQSRSRYLPDITDVCLTVSMEPYETYDQWLSKHKVVDRVVKIQRWFRKVKNRERQNILECLSEYREQHVHTKEELRKKLDTDLEDEVTAKKNKDVSKNPSNRQDFDVLYTIIGKWWSNEIQRIREISDETVKKKEYMNLLQKEIYYLSKLDRYRAESRDKAQQKQILCVLSKASKPKKMITSNNKEITICTLETQRATVLKNIYVKIIRRDVTMEERIDILNELKHILSQCHGFNFVDNILALVRKETDQMIIGVPNKNLEMTRTRIELLFSKLIDFPEYNKNSNGSGDIRMSRKSKGSTPEQKYLTCSRCNRTLPASEYPSSAMKTVHRICNSCEWVENVGSKRIDLKPYKQMLNNIQRKELDRNSTSSLCFGMQPSGMFYLVNVIWDGRSAVTEDCNVTSLQCIRWDRTLEWSPWNCIVLTTEEADLHENISDVKDFYSAAFITKVTLRHISARIQFLSLAETEDRVQFTGEFNKLTETDTVFLDESYVKSFMNIDSQIH